jgi:DUF3078 family protein
MRTTHYLTFIFLLAIATLKAQDTKTDAENLQSQVGDLKAAVDTSSKHWKKGGIITLNGQEGTQFNWAAGGQNAISVGGLVNMFFNYHKGKIIWNNSLILAYGVIKQGSIRDWIKTDDRIQFTTKVGRQAFKKGYYTMLGDFKSQFTPGYNYPNDSTKISTFMAPGYVLAALGLDLEVDSNLSFFISPATGRFTFVEDKTLAKAGAYGVQAEVDDSHGNVITPYKNVREQIGAYLKMQYRKNVMTNVGFGTTLELYADYLHNPQDMYVNWTTFIVMKVNKFISATFNTQLIYDPAVKVLVDGNLVGPRVQFKQILGIGLAYKF